MELQNFPMTRGMNLRTWHVVHDHVEVLVVLKGVVKLDDPLRVRMRHDVSLLPEERRIRPLHHLKLAQQFHRVYLHIITDYV